MKAALFATLLMACELEPGPKTAPAPAPAAPAQPAAAAQPKPAPPPTPAPAPTQPEGGKQVPIATGQDACTDVAVKYTEIGLAEAKDPQLKQQLEVERARTVQRMAQGCRDQKWSGDILDCYRAAKSSGDLAVCTKKLAPQVQQRPAAKDEPTAAPKPPAPPTPAPAKAPKAKKG